jgi:TPR repeat protein
VTPSTRHSRYPFLKWFSRLGVGVGHAPSMVVLGAIYESGPEGIEAANSLYRRAAEAGNAQAMCQLGINYLPTKDGENDQELAVHWLTKAVENGDPMAAWALGRMSLAGNPVEKNVGRGLDLLRRSAEAGYRPACQSLSQIYRTGSHGVTADNDQAIEWFIKSRPRLDRIRIKLRLARVELGE